VLEKVEHLKGDLIPSEVTVTTTRNYGETASEKSNELLLHMMIAIFSVAALIWLTLGLRESGIVATAIPVTLALTLAVFYFYGYTLNRITLFALIFSIGILVDDAIVVVENIVRHYRLPENKGRPIREVAVAAVDEVGNPTILATFAVIAAILPMAFVGGLMGPYMKPIPVGATAAMLFSLLVAFIVTPWASVRLVKKENGRDHGGGEEGRVQPKYRFVVDKEKAALNGVSAEHVATTLRIAVEGVNAGLLHQPQEKEDAPISLRLARAERSGVDDLKRIKVMGRRGNLVPLGELARVEEQVAEKSIYHKNLMPVTYVTGDVAGSEESPVYAILKLNEAIEQLKLPEGYSLERYVASQPFIADKYAMKWDGEWHITYEVFRDLGVAFAAVLALIYILVVGWFQSFKTPLTIMAAIPFSLVGILPAHGLIGAFFTATSMIGFIAGAGIVVRNSIILVDFVELRLKQGMPLAEAVIDAGAVRFRPMMLTAAAVVVGAFIILFDPIFQGLAISLMAGEIASLLLSRMTVPVLYYLSECRKHTPAETVRDFSESGDSTVENHASAEVEVAN
jgi:multidrug efflux pump subunit AcrB